jgi:hypothetical protein
MSPHSPKLNLKSCTLIVERYSPSAEMLIHVHKLLAEKGEIEYPFIQVSSALPQFDLSNYMSFTVGSLCTDTTSELCQFRRDIEPGWKKT